MNAMYLKIVESMNFTTKLLILSLPYITFYNSVHVHKRGVKMTQWSFRF